VSPAPWKLSQLQVRTGMGATGGGVKWNFDGSAGAAVTNQSSEPLPPSYPLPQALSSASVLLHASPPTKKKKKKKLCCGRDWGSKWKIV
jgi:hypothetical protein